MRLEDRASVGGLRLGVGALLTGGLLGVTLSRVGFTSWDAVHRMFTFEDFLLFKVYAMAAALLVPAWFLIQRLAKKPLNLGARPIRRGTVLGGILFGVGWAITGACPGVIFAQMGEGQMAALYTLFGVFAGNALYGVIEPRFRGDRSAR